jgi:hypothetical protein
MAAVGNEKILLSSSHDGTIKAWKFLDPAGKPLPTLTLALTKNIN